VIQRCDDATGGERRALDGGERGVLDEVLLLAVYSRRNAGT
jgi:hypothetical protein